MCRVFQNSSWRSSRRFVGHAHFETDGDALCAVCFKNLRDEAPVASWRNGLYGCILRTQRSRGTIWNRRRCAVCRVFQNSSWRSSRRFVEKWVAWMYIKDAALKRHNLKQKARRCVPCVSKVFVTKLPSLRGEFDYMDVYWRRSAEMNFLNQMAPRCVLYVSKLFVTKLPSLRGEMVYMGVYWRRSAEMHIFKQTAWHCVLYVSKLFVTKLPALRGRGSSYLTKWWYNKSFETVGHLMDFRCRRMFQNCVHVAPGVAWRSVE